ncbi:MAG: hypothetical protein O2912_00355 [Proteobacteria bacterium]|nr:hypothetical protein [Pseudomonadota bacterium]
MTVQDDEFDLDALVSNASEAFEEAENAVASKKEEDRSLIAKIIVWAFVAFIGVTIIFIFYASQIDPCETCKTDSWSAPAERLMTILSSIMLPVVTLVLGYYFGKEK